METEKFFVRNKPKYNDLGDGVDLKQLADRVMSIPGNAKGETIISNLKGIQIIKREEGLKSLEEKMKELGYPMFLKNINTREYYLESYSLLINIVYKSLFNGKDIDIFNLGRNSAKISFLARVMMRYFVSLEVLQKQASRYWRMNLDFGELEVTDIDYEKKELSIRVSGYNKSSVSCVFQGGYFYETLRPVLKDTLFVEEIKCIHAGDPFHEYRIMWN